MAKLKVLDNYNKKVLSGKCRGFLQNLMLKIAAMSGENSNGTIS